MDKPHRFLTSQHRRRRLALWAVAMLTWLAAVCFGNAPLDARHVRKRRCSIDALALMTAHLIMVRAGELSRRRRRKLRFWRHGRDLRRRHFIRSLLGARLRRVLTHKDPATRVAKLIAALRKLDACAKLLAKRRLTRLFAIKAAPTQAAPLLSAQALAPSFANSS